MALELFVISFLVILGVVVLLTGLLQLLERAEPTQSDRAVLPSHYSSLLNFDAQYYPGHCTRCGTDNEPGFRYCENCGSQIPTSRDFSSRSDVRQIFNE